MEMSVFLIFPPLALNKLFKGPFRKHVHAIYRKYFGSKMMKIFNEKYFDIFAQNIDCGYTFEPPRRSMFWGTNKKNRYTLHTPVFLYKSGV